MKLVLLTRSLNYGGAERQLVTLARGMVRRGHAVEVVVFYSDGPLQRELEDSGIPVSDLAKRHRWDVVGFGWRLLRVLRAARADVVHGYLVAPNLLAVLLRPWLAPARIVWGVRASDMDFRRYDALANFTFQASRVLARYADLIVVNSVAGVAFHEAHGFPADRMRTIPNGIDTERFKPDAAAGRAQREAWGIAPDERVVGLVGRLDPMKDHPMFLAAAAQLAARHGDLRFVLVGSGPEGYRRRLVATVEESGLTGDVVWTGSCPDMRAVYGAFDVAVSSSAFGEGFPNVVAEAMACGVPCVVTDVGDTRAVVGPEGCVVPKGDATALADAITRILDAPPEAARLRRRVIEKFSVDRLVDRTESVLLELTGSDVGAAGRGRASA